MNAKKTLLALLIAAGPTLAMAANEIRFEGQVTASTCDVAVNGSATPIVLLPSATAAEVNGATAAGFGETAFNVAVSGCTVPPLGGVTLKTVFTGNAVDADGNLGNTGTATGVALQIATAAGSTTPINLTTTWTSTGTTDGIHLADGVTSGNKDYYVRYYSRGANATPGSVRASLQYAIVYP